MAELWGEATPANLHLPLRWVDHPTAEDVACFARLMDLHAAAMRAAPLTPAAHERLVWHWRAGLFRVLLAGEVGFSLVYRAYSSFVARPTLYWEDGFVEQPWRDAGVGSRMYQEILNHAREIGAGALVFSVQDWNVGVMRFHERHGAVRQVGRSAYKLKLADEP